jgi:hypothetical protein
MKTPILGSAYVARSVNAADNRMINLFPEIVPEAGKEPAFLQRAPGLRLLASVGSGPVRGLWAFGGYGYVASGNTLYRVNSSWQVTTIGTLTGTGPVSMADNGTQLFIACNGPSFIYNASLGAFSQITDPDFPGAVTVGYLDGYFVFNEPTSQRIWVTSLLDGTSVDPLDFASAEGSPDGLVSLIIDHREAWLFGTNSVEVWYDSGAVDFPLTRIQGAFNEIGCAAAFSVARLDNGLFWLGADARGRGIVYRANGYTGQRISTHAVEWQIQQYGNLADAVGYTYQQDGHAFYVLNFPTANTTWVYDVSTSAWHERAGWDAVTGTFLRHRSNCQMSFANEIVVGDYENGNIYALDLDVYADNGTAQKWLRSWRALPTGQNNLKRTAHHTLQLDCETGVGLNVYNPPEIVQTILGLLLAEGIETDVGLLLAEDESIIDTENDEPLTVTSLTEAILTTQSGVPLTVTSSAVLTTSPKVMLRWSDDGGHTWSNEHWTSIGRVGEYGHRAFWRRLGMTLKLRDRVYEISGTDPVKIAIMGAELNISGTNA